MPCNLSNTMLDHILRIVCILSVGTIFGKLDTAVVAASGIQNSIDDEQRVGCFHDGTVFANGSMVPTLEPCLSCQCNVNTLVCSLRVCPEMPVPPPRGCVLVHKKTGCCPYLSCKKYHAPYDGPNRRIVAYLDHYERETIDRVVNDNVLQRRSDDSEYDSAGEICIVNGTVYKSGSAMSSSSLCSYCYCIGGVQKCVRPKCMLNMEGCKAIYVDSTCCPVRYDCSSKNSGIVKASRFHVRSSNKHYLRVIGRTQRSRGCVINSTFYHEGQKLPTDPERHCDICFCIHGSRKCGPKKCAPALKNCIPVVPKGQCCPSSYDCNNTREPGRQFDLFSLLFGGGNNGSTIASPVMVTSGSPVSSTTDKTFLDTIREGLQYIDNNESTVADVLKKLNIINETTSGMTVVDGGSEGGKTDLVNDSSVNDDEDGGDVSILDILLGNDKKKEASPAVGNYSHASGNEVNENDETSLQSSKVSQSKEKNETETYEHNTESSENNTVISDLEEDTSPATIDHTTEEEAASAIPTSTVDYASEEQDEYLYGTTEDRGESAEYLDNENDEDGHEVQENIEANESTTEMGITGIVTTENEGTEVGTEAEIESENTSTEINSSTEVESKKDSVELPASESNQDNSTEDVSYEDYSSSQTSTELKEDGDDEEEEEDEVESDDGGFLSALFNGLSKILEPSVNKTNATIMNGTASTAITTTSTKPTIATESLANITYSDSSVKPVNVAPPVTTQHPITITQGSLFYSTSFEATTMKANATSSVNATTVSTLDTTMAKLTTEARSSTKADTFSSTTPAQPTPIIVTRLTTGKPIIIKTNPSILEADYNFDYSEPTLPPSLPNLKIIPFLPTDALKDDRKRLTYKFYNKLKPTSSYPSITEKHENWGHASPGGAKNSISKIDYDLGYDHTGSYPSITEPFDENSRDHHKYGFSDFEYTDAADQDAISDKFDGAGAAASYDSFVKTEPPLVNRFSPPTKTEGGFVPKEPIPDQFFYENYHTTKFLVDLTTAAPKPLTPRNSSKPMITTPDPFKDVIKTEPPPDLSSLIEDKEKLLASGAPVTLFSSVGENVAVPEFDKEIISITTDTNYNFASEYKDAKDDFVESSNSTNSKLTPTAPPSTTEMNITRLSPDPAMVNVSSTKTNKTTTEADYDLGAGLESVLDLFFKDESRNDSFVGITVPPFKTISPDSAHYQLIKTFSPGTSAGDTIDRMDTIDSLEDMHILKEALTSGFDPKDTQKYNAPLRTEASSIGKPMLEDESVSLSEPFDKLPFVNPSVAVKPPKEEQTNPMHANLDLILPSSDDQKMRTNFNVGGYKVIPNDPVIAKTDSYVVNPVDIDQLKRHHSVGGAQVFTKSDSSNSINDPAGILKLAGCNIYGRMYRVGKIISELSGPCLECKCTEIGVNCSPLGC